MNTVTCKHAFIYLNSIFIHRYVYMRIICIYVHMNIYMYVCMYVYMYVYTYELYKVVAIKPTTSNYAPIWKSRPRLHDIGN